MPSLNQSPMNLDTCNNARSELMYVLVREQGWVFAPCCRGWPGLRIQEESCAAQNMRKCCSDACPQPHSHTSVRAHTQTRTHTHHETYHNGQPEGHVVRGLNHNAGEGDGHSHHPTQPRRSANHRVCPIVERVVPSNSVRPCQVCACVRACACVCV